MNSLKIPLAVCAFFALPHPLFAQNMISGGGFNDPASWVIQSAGGRVAIAPAEENPPNVWPTTSPYGVDPKQASPDFPGVLQNNILRIYHMGPSDLGSATSANPFSLTQGNQYLFAIDFLYVSFFEPSPESEYPLPPSGSQNTLIDVDIINSGGEVAYHLIGASTGTAPPGYDDLTRPDNPYRTDVPEVRGYDVNHGVNRSDYMLFQIPLTFSGATGDYKVRINASGTDSGVLYGSYEFDVDRLYLGAIPEPSSVMICCAGFVGLLGRRRRSR